VAGGSEVTLDIGANIGCTAILFAQLSKKVYAFEPSPTTFALLERNILRSGLRNVSLQNIGLGAEPGRVHVDLLPLEQVGGFCLKPNAGQRRPYSGENNHPSDR